MNRTKNNEAKELWDENDMLQDADFSGLNLLREMISPYWSTRVVVEPETRKPLDVLDGQKKKERKTV
jgi:hypothetical protein